MILLCYNCKNFIHIDGLNTMGGEFILRKEIGNAYVPVFCCDKCMMDCDDAYYILENAIPVIKEKRS